MRLPRFMGPVWSLAALGLALTLLTAPVAARADDDDDDNGRQGTVKIYGGDDAQGGYLGVQVQDVTRALQRARGLTTDEGALVSRVEDESPADQAGIRRGDVITEVDREKIDSSQDLIKVVRGLSPGSRARVTLWRSGSLRTVTVQLGERPAGMMPGMGMPDIRFRTGDDDHPMPPPSRMNDRDVEQQIRDLRDQLRELRQEIQSLRREMQRSNGRDDDHDNDRSRGNDSDDDD